MLIVKLPLFVVMLLPPVEPTMVNDVPIVELPIVIVFALALVPIATIPVVPTSILTLPVVVDAIDILVAALAELTIDSQYNIGVVKEVVIVGLALHNGGKLSPPDENMDPTATSASLDSVVVVDAYKRSPIE